MRIDNPLYLNDWNIKSFIGVVFGLQSAVIFLVALGLRGIDVPIIRPLIVAFYLAFIPGYLVLRVLGLHKLSAIETLVYAVCLSLATLMLTGLLLNVIGPSVGVHGPLSTVPITVALCAVVLSLSALACLRDKDFSSPVPLDAGALLSPQALFMYLMPFLAIFGTYAMNERGDNLLLIILLVIIALVVLLVGFEKLIPKEIFPIVIASLSIALLLHKALISPALIGSDIHIEKYVIDMAISGSIWNPAINIVDNSMLSLVMLGPIFSIMMNVDSTWTLKLVYPMLFSLVPLGLYHVFRKQSNDTMAFMAAFFFIALDIFYTEMLQLARQEIAEIFLVALVMLIVDRGMEKTRWAVLFTLFSFSLIVSHYGTTYIFLGSILTIWALLHAIKFIKNKFPDIPFHGDVNGRISILSITAFASFCLIWYIYTSNSNAFRTILSLSDNISGSLLSEFLKPSSAQGLAVIQTGGSASPLHKLYLYIMLFTQLVIFAGVVTSLIKNKTKKFTTEFYALSVVNILILIAGLAVPYFASALNTSRLYQLSLIFLSIFFVVGWLNAFEIFNIATGKRIKAGTSIAIKTLSIFLVVYLAFNSGLVFELAKDVPTSYSLNSSMDTTVFTAAEVAGGGWITGVRNVTPINTPNGTINYVPPIFSDNIRNLLLSEWLGHDSLEIPANYSTITGDSYVYLGNYNVNHDKIRILKTIGISSRALYMDDSGLTYDRDKIYSNGGAAIYTLPYPYAQSGLEAGARDQTEYAKVRFNA